MMPVYPTILKKQKNRFNQMPMILFTKRQTFCQKQRSVFLIVNMLCLFAVLKKTRFVHSGLNICFG